MHPFVRQQMQNRRVFFASTASGIGAAALASLLDADETGRHCLSRVPMRRAEQEPNRPAWHRFRDRSVRPESYGRRYRARSHRPVESPE